MKVQDDASIARSTLQRSLDPRAQRTRASIVAAVRTLCDAGEEVSVSSIGRTAGVSRATFYAHYAGIVGLAKSMRLDAFRAVDELFRFDVHTTPDALRLRQVRLVRHFADHRALYAAVSAMPVSHASYLAGVRVWAAIIREALEDHPNRPPGVRADAIATFVASGTFGLIEDWVSGAVEMTEDELVDLLFHLAPEWIRRTV